MPDLPDCVACAYLEHRYTRMVESRTLMERAVQSFRKDIPKHHQDRTWSIYGKSVPQLFFERVASRPDAVALRYKDFGLYQEVTWRKYRDEVEAFALGLMSLGVEPGDRIAIMGDPCFEYFVADMAGLAAGAITYGIYTPCSPAEVRHQLENAGARIFIAENQEYVD